MKSANESAKLSGYCCFWSAPPENWSGNEPAWVANGFPISDAEIAAALEVPQTIVARHRVRLRKIGLLGWLISPGKGRAFWIAGLNQVFGSGETSSQPQAAAQVIPPQSGPAAELWNAIQERSIALTGKMVDDLTPAEGSELARVLAQVSKNPCDFRPRG